MPDFDYTAIEPATGRTCRGTLVSASPLLAAKELRKRGLAPTSLAPTLPTQSAAHGAHESPIEPKSRRRAGRIAGIRLSWPMGRVVSRKNLTLFTRQLATLQRAGLPLLRALEVLARPERNLPFQRVINGLADAIRAGRNLSDGLRKFPRIFDELYVTMVHAGEASGALELVLDRLARFRERTERIQGRVKAAMTYPAVILVVAGSILTGLMMFVVPRFQLIFTGVLKGQPLPPLTRLVIGTGDFVHHHFFAGLAGCGLLWLALRLLRNSRAWIGHRDRWLLRAPVWGDLLLKAAVARFTRSFGSLLASGVPILDALMITRAASGNVHITEALTRVHDRVREGGTVAQALEATAIFPSMVTSMIEVGEETGALAEMLGRIADTYDEEVDNGVAALTHLIEPIMIVLMALVVGVIVIALFLPIVGIIQHLQ